MNPRYILLDGKAYVWRELVKMRREQLRAVTKVQQLTLFELKEDVRSESHRTATGRYLQPSLFTPLEGRKYGG
jgi:hypothetical protein